MPRARSCAAIALIFIVTLVAYIPAMRSGLVWNDEEVGSLTKNIVLEENGLYRVWFTTESVNYWPIVWTSYWMEHQLWGLNPTGYHVVNVVLHALCALLIWRILIRLNIPGAWLAALVFAVHPVNVESVAWITQRKNVLALCFFLIAMLSYLRCEDLRRRAWYGAAVLSFLLAMLSKGSAVTLPVVLLLCAWWRRHALSRRDLFRSLPFFVVAVLMSSVEIWFQYARSIGEDVIRDDTLLERLVGAGWVVWFYIYKALLPLRLCFIYPRWELDPTSWPAYLPGLALLVLLALGWRYRRSWGRPLLFALGYFVITLGPVLGFVNIYFMRYSFVADHYQYVSIVGIIALVIGVAWKLFVRGGPGRIWLGRAAAVALVLVLGLLTWRQAGAYENAETLWRDTLRKNPAAWMAHSNLANLLTTRGELDEAIRHYREALRLKDDNAEVYNNLGNALALQRKPDEAMAYYHRALQLRPDYADAHNNLGLVLALRGELDQAIDHYRRALRSAPDYAQAHVNLAHALVRQQLLGAAIHHYKQALQSHPDHVEAHTGLAAVLWQQGQIEQALVHYRQAVEIAPDSARTHHNLALVLTRLGRPEDALPHLRQAAQLKPDWPAPLKELAWILATHRDATVRREQEALQLAERAADLTQHKDGEVLDVLAAAQAALGQFDQAVRTAEEALALVSVQSADALGEGIRVRLGLYRQGQAYRAGVPSGGTRDP